MIGAILDLTFYRGDTDNKCVNKRVCLVTQESSWTLCDPMDCSPPSSSVHGILQVRVLEWVAISFSRVPGGEEWLVISLLSRGDRWVYHKAS